MLSLLILSSCKKNKDKYILTIEDKENLISNIDEYDNTRQEFGNEIEFSSIEIENIENVNYSYDLYLNNEFCSSPIVDKENNRFVYSFTMPFFDSTVSFKKVYKYDKDLEINKIFYPVEGSDRDIDRIKETYYSLTNEKDDEYTSFYNLSPIELDEYGVTIFLRDGKHKDEDQHIDIPRKILYILCNDTLMELYIYMKVLVVLAYLLE